MANSADPDQKQFEVWSGSALFAYANVSQNIVCVLYGIILNFLW